MVFWRGRATLKRAISHVSKPHHMSMDELHWRVDLDCHECLLRARTRFLDSVWRQIKEHHISDFSHLIPLSTNNYHSSFSSSPTSTHKRNHPNRYTHWSLGPQILKILIFHLQGCPIGTQHIHTNPCKHGSHYLWDPSTYPTYTDSPSLEPIQKNKAHILTQGAIISNSSQLFSS